MYCRSQKQFPKPTRFFPCDYIIRCQEIYKSYASLFWNPANKKMTWERFGVPSSCFNPVVVVARGNQLWNLVVSTRSVGDQLPPLRKLLLLRSTMLQPSRMIWAGKKKRSPCTDCCKEHSCWLAKSVWMWRQASWSLCLRDELTERSELRRGARGDMVFKRQRKNLAIDGYNRMRFLLGQNDCD